MIADIAVAGVLLVSGVLAFSMGLVKFLLLIASWVGAAVAAYLGFLHLGPYFEGIVKDPLFQAIAAAGTLFIVSLIVLTIATHMISNHVRGSVLGHLDRALGFVFGLFLGVILVSMIYIGLTLFWPDEDDFPKEIAEAKTLPLIRAGAGALVSLMPEGAFTQVRPRGDELGDAVEGVEDAVKGLATDKIDQLGDTIDSLDAEDRLNKLMKPEPPADEPPAENGAEPKPGYGNDERSDMQRLIENNQ
jgi:membrane protein required for colicin V production